MKMPGSKMTIPPELKRRVSPPLFSMIAEHRTFLKLFGTGLEAYSLYGPVRVRPDHNGFLYLFGPWICPSIVAIYYTFFPWRPYRGIVFLERTGDIDVGDPVVMRLMELFSPGRLGVTCGARC